MRFSSSSSSSSTGRRRRRRSLVSWVPWLLLLFSLLLFLFLFFFQSDLLARSGDYDNSLQNGSSLSRALEAFGQREKFEKDSISHHHEHHPISGHPSMLSFCEAWLEAKDKVIYSRNFSARPIVVGYGENEASFHLHDFNKSSVVVVKDNQHRDIKMCVCTYATV